MQEENDVEKWRGTDSRREMDESQAIARGHPMHGEFGPRVAAGIPPSFPSFD